MCKLTMEAEMADGGKCQIANFKNTTRVLTIGDVSPDYRCHQYSNLTYPLGIGPLGCDILRFFIVYRLSASVPSQGFASSRTLTRDLVLYIGPSHSEYLGYSAEHIRCKPTRTE